MAVTVKQCCCGCSLKTGTIIIGVLYVIGALAGMVSNVMNATAKPMSPEMAKKYQISEEAREKYNTLIKGVAYTSIVVAIILAIHLIVSILLIIGASNENPRLVKPWIIYSTVAAILTGLIYFVLMIVFFIVYVNAAAGAGILIGGGISIALTAYFIIVVKSFHKELLGQRDPSKI